MVIPAITYVIGYYHAKIKNKKTSLGLSQTD
jgi:hypothetical protein